jgi:hypothetical protein
MSKSNFVSSGPSIAFVLFFLFSCSLNNTESSISTSPEESNINLAYQSLKAINFYPIPPTISLSWTVSNSISGIFCEGFYSVVYVYFNNTAYDQTTIYGEGTKSYTYIPDNVVGTWRLEAQVWATRMYVSYAGRWYTGPFQLNTFSSSNEFCELKYSPEYDPDFWNVSDIQNINNCYNYACNKLENSIYKNAQPGFGSGCTFEQYHYNYSYTWEKAFIEASGNDGLIYIGIIPLFLVDIYLLPSYPNYTLAALMIGENGQFHWYRQDRDGFWSSKNYNDPVKNVDSTGSLIYDPQIQEKAWLPNCKIFLGYFFVPNPNKSGAQNKGTAIIQ